MHVPRRWFKYSLRTFFVLLTALVVWLGYQVNWIRARRQERVWIDEHTYKNGPAVSPYLNLLQSPSTGATGYQTLVRPWVGVIVEERQAPWSLLLLGEESLPYVQLDGRMNIDERDIRRIERLFPEAKVEKVPDPRTMWHSAPATNTVAESEDLFPQSSGRNDKLVRPARLRRVAA